MMYIGELARRAGATPKAIRLYESLGLLGTVQRCGAYRVYSDKQREQVQLVKQAQTMGFRLADIRPAMDGRSAEPDWLLLSQQVERKHAETLQEIRRLQALTLQLQHINTELRACAGL